MSGWTIIAIVAAIFVLWHFIPQAKPVGASPKFKRDPRINAENPHWRKFVEARCESPAEIAFLTAMIDAYRLQPMNGALQADGLKLDLQVEDGGYRVDFLANEWLVIEIDGAAYHSSEQAKARDQRRDEYLESLGYSVVRVPAKAVFTEPPEAIRRVSAALTVGKRKVEEPSQVSGFDRLGQTMSGLSRAVEELNDNVSRQRRIEAALNQPQLAFSIEKKVIDSAVESARRQREIDDYLSESDEMRASFDRFKSELEEAFARHDRENSRVASSHQLAMEVPQFPPFPNTDENEDISFIEVAYSKLVAERRCYLDGVRQQIRDQPGLAALVQRMLAEMGCPQVWELLK